MCPPPLVSEGRGPHLGTQQASWAQVGGANTLLSSPAPPAGVWERPSLLPLLITPASSYARRTHVAWMGFWSGEKQLGSSAGSPARVGQSIALCSSPALPGESFLPASPDLPGLKGADPVWPPLLLPPQPSYVLPVHSGVSCFLGH